MKIAKGRTVTLHFSLTGEDGSLIDSSLTSDPLTIVHGQGMVVPGLEQALESRSAGDQFQVKVPPEQGYGQHQENLTYQVAKADFGPEASVEVGMRVDAHGEEGEFLMLVTEVDGETVTLDANHPLAGQILTFDLTVINVSESDTDEA